MNFQNKYVQIDQSRFPLVVFTFSAHDPTNQEFDEYLHELTDLYTKEKPFVAIFDCANFKYLRAELRIKQGQWSKHHKRTVDKKFLGAAFYMPTLATRTILSGIFLIQKPDYPYTVVSTIQEAEKFVLEKLAEAKIPAHTI